MATYLLQSSAIAKVVEESELDETDIQLLSEGDKYRLVEIITVLKVIGLVRRKLGAE